MSTLLEFSHLVFPTLVGMSIVAGVVAALAVALGVLLRRRADVRHAAGAAALSVALLAPVLSWTSDVFSIHVPLPAGESASVATLQPTPDSVAVAPNIAAFQAPTMQRTASPTPVAVAVSESPLVPALSAPAFPDPDSRPAVGYGSLAIRAGFVAAWLLGSLILLARLAWGLVRVAGLRRDARVLEDAGLVAQVAEALGVSAERLPRIALSTRAVQPLALGVVRPLVLIPDSFIDRLSAASLRDVLAHECAHILRRDPLIGLFQRLATVLHWPNPLIHLLNRSLSSAREDLCDNHALRATTPAAYAASLLAVAELRPSSVGAADVFALSILDRRGSLESRIVHLVDPRRCVRTRTPRALAVALLIAATTAGTAAAAIRLQTAEPIIGNMNVSNANVSSKESNGEDESTSPQVVEVFPPDGSRDVALMTEIRLRFDRPMDPSRAFFVWDSREPHGYRPRGSMQYDEESRTFTLPVHLSPGGRHRIMINTDHGGRIPHEGFRSADGDLAAEPFSWSFTTAESAPAEGAEPPRITSVDPPTETQLALLTPLRITFDRPMNPSAYDLAEAEPADLGRDPRLFDHPHYDPESRTFTLLLKLPPNWNGAIRLIGFRSTEGGVIEPITLRYRTLREPLAEVLQSRGGNDNPKLGRFMDQVREARRALPGIHEDVILTQTFSPRSSGWSQRYSLSGATFAVRGKHHFYGEIDEIIGKPFRIGGDGENCWFHQGDEVSILPFDAIPEKNVLVGDPFEAAVPSESSDIIRRRKLEDLGESVIHSRPCRRIRSWDIQLVGADFLTSPVDWYIDVESLLPIRVSAGSLTMDFAYRDLGKPIPEEVFHRPVGPGIREVEAEPLSEGYTRRFLNVIDGGNSRMSVRWGSLGPAGKMSSGLN